jgi:hypothetical protein
MTETFGMADIVTPPTANRRGFLGAGGLMSAAALIGSGRFALAESATRRPAIRSCIFVFHYGGPSQLETWDPKPEAPLEVRGPCTPIETNVSGTRISEYLPQMSRVMNHVTLVRSLHHPMRNHNSAAAEMLTGKTPLRGDLELLGDDPLGPPCLGSALTAVLGLPADGLAHAALPYVMYNVVQLPGQTAGFLGARFERFQIEGDPNRPDFQVRSLTLPEDVSAQRFTDRTRLSRTLDRQPSDAHSVTAMNEHFEKAFSSLGSRRLQLAMEMQREPDSLRERYGRNLLGQSLLLARRLVEGGVRMISVFDGQANCQTCNWDSHNDNFGRHKDVLVPPMDRGLSALISDLADRGLLESTLVISVGEFGRTPRLNANQAGRDHWPDVFTAMLAGGGAPGGTIIGASDGIGAYPARDPVSPGDLAATLFSQFGIDPSRELIDPTGRPHRLAEGLPLF